jgi:sialic acid synthase SpsE/mannose-6-phosphate isomerase-like protein (cupin superfamily)
MLYVFEMANNHQGSVEHAKKIIDQFSSVAKECGINAAVKLQFRQLDSFVHKDFKESDLKFVKRFNSTRLSKDEFREIIRYIREKGLVPMSTPFDNESLRWISDFNLPVVKIASCSVDDWPLLYDVAKINKKIIISTGGASLSTLKKVYELFKSNNRDFAFMHCVGEYPTPIECSNLNRITALKEEFPDIEIGYSTHESPDAVSMTPAAVALGCTIVEKHVGVETETISLNKYSNTPEQMKSCIKQIQLIQSAMLGKSTTQNSTLKTLKRGVYLNKPMLKGQIVRDTDLYYAMPVQENQFNASQIEGFIGQRILKDVDLDSPLNVDCVSVAINKEIVKKIKLDTIEMLKNAGIPITGLEKTEISCHYGIDNFSNIGALIIDKINREYCKKLIVMFNNQKHPTHHHIKKEECFELLFGDCRLILNGKTIDLVKGEPILIPRGVNHSFSTTQGCVIEEVSTTHFNGDSIYNDVEINSLKLSERKIKLNLKEH